MSQKAMFFIFLSVLAGLNIGTVRKAEDPIRDTQTNPILYEQKKEEEKDGKKGPLMYNVKYNPRETFFIDPPVEAAKKEGVGESAAWETPKETGAWWEEQPTSPLPEAVMPASDALVEPLPEFPEPEGEAVAEPLYESAGEEEEVAQESASEQPSDASETEAKKDGKEEDYWW